MSLHQMQKLNRDLKKYEQENRSQARKIMVLQNQCETQKDIVKKLNREKQFLGQQIKELRRREQEQKYIKEETENRYANALTKIQEELEERKKKYNRLESKIQPLVDHDTVRLKILNEVESVHFAQIQQYKRKNNHFKEEILKLKRQNQLLKHELESNKIDFNDEIRRLRNQMQNNNRNGHLNELTYEMCSQIQNRLKLNYQEAKKQADYYKQKYFASQKKYQQRVTILEKQIIQFKQRLLNH